MIINFKFSEIIFFYSLILKNSRYCGSPADYGVESQLGELQYESLEFGILNFDNFFNSCLTNLTFLTFTGWGMATNLVPSLKIK